LMLYCTFSINEFEVTLPVAAEGLGVSLLTFGLSVLFTSATKKVGSSSKFHCKNILTSIHKSKICLVNTMVFVYSSVTKDVKLKSIIYHCITFVAYQTISITYH
jgi:hypothetical protein